MLTRRDILQQTGRAAAIMATTAPWWLVRRAHAARQHKLVVWNPAALAPQVDKIMQEQCYAYAKQAGIKDSEIDYSIIGSAQILSKLVASLEAGTPPDIARLDPWITSLYRSQGHLLEVTDMVEKMRRVPGGLFPVFDEVMHQGKAYAIPQSISPSPLVARMDFLAAAKVEPPKTWDEFIEVCKKLQQPPKLTGYGMCLGLTGDTNGNVMSVIWSFGGKLVEADNKTVTLHSPGTVKAVQFIADMYLKHKIIPKGAISWDNTGNNKAYQSRQVIFVQNATSIYAYLAESDKELYDTTGLLPMPAGPAGAFATLSSHILDALQAQSLSRGGQGARRVLDGPGESPGDDRGRGRTLGATVQRHVRFRLLEAAGVSRIGAGCWRHGRHIRLPRHGASRRR